MSCLSVYHQSTPDIPNKVLTHLEDIASTLGEVGIGFERHLAGFAIQAGASQEQVITAYRAQIDQLMSKGNYVALDVLSVSGEHPQRAERRARFQEEQRLQASEARFFVAGRGLLSVRVGDYVYVVLCEKNDLIVMPAGTSHWFDTGEFPRCVAIRMFDKEAGWAATVTGDDIARHFPLLED